MSNKLYLSQYKLKITNVKHGTISNSIRLRLIESTNIESAKMKLFEHYKDNSTFDFYYEVSDVVITESI